MFKSGGRDLIKRLERVRRRLSRRSNPAAAVAVATAEAQARQAEHRLREAIDALPEGIVFLDKEGRYVLWNKRYSEIYHRSSDLFCEGARLADTLRIGVARGDYPEAVGREEAWMAERLALLHNPGVRHEQRLADGRWVMIEERNTSDGGVIGLRVDITEMKAQAAKLQEALAQAQAASRAKSDFLANMSHEIRTPLNGVLGLADVLSRTRLDDRQRELLSTIMASANDLNVLLGDILDVSRLEAGKVEVTPHPMAVDDLVRESVALFRANAAQKGLKLTADLDGSAAGQVLGDRTRIKQILTNLLSNAIKFTAQGEVTVSLRRLPDGVFRFQVRDTGVGFEPAVAERLFERFEQADGSTTRQFGGAGLGLSICRQLADLMGGRIFAEGRKNEGATFTLDLPLPAVAGAEPVATQVAPRLNILVVDDNATNRKVIELMLESIGAKVETCENGALALEAVSGGRFDLILMDMQMPVMDGLAATREIRASPGAPPVIMISANHTAADRRESAKAGATAHIGKPLRIEELVSTVMAALDQRALERVA